MTELQKQLSKAIREKDALEATIAELRMKIAEESNNIYARILNKWWDISRGNSTTYLCPTKVVQGALEGELILKGKGLYRSREAFEVFKEWSEYINIADLESTFTKEIELPDVVKLLEEWK